MIDKICHFDEGEIALNRAKYENSHLEYRKTKT